MNRTLRKTTLLITSALFLLNAACTTVKPIYANSQETYASQIKIGDKVRLTYINDRVRDIKVTGIDEQEIRGMLHKGTLKRARGAVIVSDWKDVYAVESVKISALKTTGAAVGIVVAMPFLALGAVMMGGSGSY